MKLLFVSSHYSHFMFLKTVIPNSKQIIRVNSFRNTEIDFNRSCYRTHTFNIKSDVKSSEFCRLLGENIWLEYYAQNSIQLS